jgi:hypothetical protein
VGFERDLKGEHGLRLVLADVSAVAARIAAQPADGIDDRYQLDQCHQAQQSWNEHHRANPSPAVVSNEPSGIVQVVRLPHPVLAVLA